MTPEPAWIFAVSLAPCKAEDARSLHIGQALFHQLLAHPVNHGHAGFESLDDPAVTPPFTSFRDIGLQQYPRLQQLLRWALSFPNQRFQSFAFLAAQPHNIFLYRNLLRRHDYLPRQ